jgi:ankyrin repeat protein
MHITIKLLLPTCINVTGLHFHAASCTHTLRALQMSDIIERVKCGDVDAVTAVGVDLSARTHWGETLLHVASRCGHLAVLNALIALGQDVAARNNHGATPLHSASFNGHLAIVQTLLSMGATLDAATSDGATPLFVACQYGHIQVVSALIAAGASMFTSSRYGNNPLHVAVMCGYFDIVLMFARTTLRCGGSALGSMKIRDDVSLQEHDGLVSGVLMSAWL